MQAGIERYSRCCSDGWRRQKVEVGRNVVVDSIDNTDAVFGALPELDFCPMDLPSELDFFPMDLPH